MARIGRDQTYRAVIDHPFVKPALGLSAARSSSRTYQAIRALAAQPVHDPGHEAEQGLPGSTRAEWWRWLGHGQLRPGRDADPQADAQANPEAEPQSRLVQPDSGPSESPKDTPKPTASPSNEHSPAPSS